MLGPTGTAFRTTWMSSVSLTIDSIVLDGSRTEWHTKSPVTTLQTADWCSMHRCEVTPAGPLRLSHSHNSSLEENGRCCARRKYSAEEVGKDKSAKIGDLQNAPELLSFEE